MVAPLLALRPGTVLDNEGAFAVDAHQEDAGNGGEGSQEGHLSPSSIGPEGSLGWQRGGEDGKILSRDLDSGAKLLLEIVLKTDLVGEKEPIAVAGCQKGLVEMVGQESGKTMRPVK